MANKKSPLAAIKQLETQFLSTLLGIDMAGLPKKEVDLLTKFKRELTDARLDIRDYEYADSRTEQTKHAQAAKKRLNRIRKQILSISEYNVFGAVDEAQYSAELEQIIENLG